MYLVTGGAGFIGSHLVTELLRRGEGVRVFDNLSTGSLDNLRDTASLAGTLDVVEGDIRNLREIREAMAGVAGVFHQAALRSVPRSVDDPMSTNEVNVNGTLNVLMAAREASVRRLVYASSSSAYGDDPAMPKVETMTPRPISPYAATKVMGEYYCRIYSKLYGLEAVSLRYFNVFGPRQRADSKYAAVIPIFLECAMRGEPMPVHGDGLQSRDFTYVENVVSANLLAMTARSAAGQVFNVACGVSHSVLDVAAAIGRALSREVRWEHGATRAADVRHTQADVSKAKEVLGYEVKVDFDEGMRRTATHFAAGWPGAGTADAPLRPQA